MHYVLSCENEYHQVLDVTSFDSSSLHYYKVFVKMGHVGINYFYDAALYIAARSKREAAYIARNTSRVKHHHSDAVRDVIEISIDEYNAGLETIKSEPYFQCHNIQEQNAFGDAIWQNVFEEPKKETYKNNRHSLRKSYFDNEEEYDKYRRMCGVDLDCNVDLVC